MPQFSRLASSQNTLTMDVPKLFLKWFTGLALLVCFCCRSSPPIPAEPVLRLPLAENRAVLEVEGSFESLDIHVDGISIFEPLLQQPETDGQVAESVFDFMTTAYTTWNAPTGLSPRTQLYGYGYGLCHAQSKLMCAIWNRYGLRGRLVAWPRHTLAEAKINGEWQAFDAQHRRSYSRLAGQPVSFAQLQNQADPIPEGIDAAGYGNVYMRTLFQQADPKYKRTGKPLPKPRLSLANGRMIIRHRNSTAPPPPVSTAADTAERAHLIPLYELMLEGSLTNGEWHLDPGLPLLAMDFPAGTDLTISSGPLRWSGTESEPASRHLRGTTDPIRILGPPATKVQCTFALAAWIGTRLDGANSSSGSERNSGSARELAFLAASFDARARLIELEEPIFKLADPVLHPGDSSRQLDITLVWDQLTSSHRGELTLYVEELSSALPLELYQSLGRQTWTFDGATLPRQGQVTLSFPISVPIGQGSPYRPKGHLTLLARLRGPGVKAGEGYLLYRESPPVKEPGH